MFWGIIIEPNGEYETTTTHTINITQLCLETPLVDETQNKILLKIESADVILTTLTKQSVNERLSFLIERNATFTISNKTKNRIYLSGFLLRNPTSYEFEDSLIFEKESVASSIMSKTSRKSEIKKRQQVFSPKKTTLKTPSTKSVTFGGVVKSIAIESLEERIKKEYKWKNQWIKGIYRR